MDILTLKQIMTNRMNNLINQRDAAFAAGDLEVYSQIELVLNDAKITLSQLGKAEIVDVTQHNLDEREKIIIEKEQMLSEREQVVSDREQQVSVAMAEASIKQEKLPEG